MANPLSDQGWSDRDYQGMIGTLVGEVARNGNLTDYQAIADVVANRLADPAYVSEFGKTVAKQTMNPSQFSAWSSKEKSANFNAKAGFAAALNPARASAFSPAMQDRIAKAQQAVADVFVNGTARGLVQNSTAYHNAKETAKRGTGGWHNDLAEQYGSVKIGEHTFTGPGFTPQPFDNVTYNGQLGMPDVAELSLGFAPAIGNVEDLGALPDLSAPPGYGDFANKSFSQPSSEGFSLPGDYSDITAGVFDGPIGYGDVANKSFSTDGFSMPDVPAGLSLPGSASVMDASGFNTGWGDPETTASAPATTATTATTAASGFHSGVDGWSAPETYGPDMHDAQAALSAQGRIDNFADHQLPGISYGNQDKINASVMAELSPSSGFHAGVDGWSPTDTPWGATPSLATPSFGQAPMGDIEMPSTVAAPRAASVNAPAPASSFTQRASAPRETAPQEQFGGFGTFSPAEYADQVRSTFGVGKPGSGFMDAMANPTLANNYGSLPSTPDFGLGNLFGKSTPDVGFMNAMASPQHAAGYSPGILDGWTGQALKGAAFGALTGGLPGALMGGAFGGLNLDGRLGAAFSNQFGGFGLGPSWDGYDASTMGYGVGFNNRGERSHTGVDNSGNASVGDGSYSDSSGRNDNSPQGIL